MPREVGFTLNEYAPLEVSGGRRERESLPVDQLLAHDLLPTVSGGDPAAQGDGAPEADAGCRECGGDGRGGRSPPGDDTG